MTDTVTTALLSRVAQALERLAPAPVKPGDLGRADAYVWTPAGGEGSAGEGGDLAAVKKVSRIELNLLKGIDDNRDLLLANTRHFAGGLPANNALLWGARGMGKSSLIKAVHALVNRELGRADKKERKLALVEIHRADIPTLPALLHILRRDKRSFILFCDDLSFDGSDSSYKSLKAVLEGGLEGRPEHVIFYATSNRRHLMAREMIDNETSTAINPSEAVDEKVSLSDRFGLWLGFHACDQDVYFAIVTAYAKKFKLRIAADRLLAEANEWSVTRGARSGRVAWQFIQDLAGKQGKKIG